MCFPLFVCLCHVPSCCCPCLHPSPVPNHHPVCLSDWFHLCPVNSPCLVHLCPCLPRLDCSHLSLVICCLCVYIVLVFLFLVVSSSIVFHGMFFVFPLSSKFLAITTLACIIDSVFAFSLPVPLPPQPPTWITTLDCLLDSVIASSLPVPLPLQTTTCVMTLDWINDDPRCPSLIGFVCLYLDCLTVYRTHSVKVVILHLCLRVEHLNPPFPRTLHRAHSQTAADEREAILN